MFFLDFRDSPPKTVFVFDALNEFLLVRAYNLSKP